MKNTTKMTKIKAILLHLQQYGSITSWEAIKEYGATRLSAIIFNLRHKYNLNIVSEMVEFTDRYGTPTKYAKYVLVKDEDKFVF